jgi:hypothetical protein
VGRQAKIKRARKERLRRSIYTYEVMRELGIQMKNRKRAEKGKPPKKRKFRSRYEKKRATVARSLIFHVMARSLATTMGGLASYYSERS